MRITVSVANAAVLAGLVLLPSGALSATDLAPPFRVEAGGRPIDVQVGHAAPLVTDFDGDGSFDLLVGQFGDGKLRIYRNVGDNAAPRFGPFAWFQADGRDGTVPAG